MISPRLPSALLVAALVAALLGTPRVARADDDPVAAAEALLTARDAGRALAAFRALADKPGDEDPRVQSGLGRALLLTGDAFAALDPLSVAAHKRGTAADHATFSEALIAVALDRTESPSARGIDASAFLHDAVAEVAAGEKAPGAEAVAARLLLAKGRALSMLGRWKEVREALSSGAVSSNDEARDLLARACYALEDYAAAAGAWEAAGNLRAAAIAWSAANDPKGLSTYRALLATAPGDRSLLSEAAHWANRTGEAASFDSFLASLSAREAGAPKVASAVEAARGLLMEYAKRPADAAIRYRAALALGDDEVETKVALARAALAVSPDAPAALSEAAALLLDVLKASPKNPAAKIGLVWIGAKDAEAAPAAWPDRTRLARAVVIFKALSDADPEDAVGWSQLALALRLSGDLSGAIAAYDKAVLANPLDSSIANDRGLAVLATGDSEAAIAAFSAAVAVDPRDTSPRQNVARLLWLAGRDDEAEAHLFAAARSARETQGKPLLYRFLIDRVWRSRTRPEIR